MKLKDFVEMAKLPDLTTIEKMLSTSIVNWKPFTDFLHKNGGEMNVWF